jgi:hypothetical protein
MTTIATALAAAPTTLTRLIAFVTGEALLCLALLAWNLRGRS